MDSQNASGVGNPKSGGIVSDQGNNNNCMYVLTNRRVAYRQRNYGRLVQTLAL
jgi:hypothetical protein